MDAGHGRWLNPVLAAVVVAGTAALAAAGAPRVGALVPGGAVQVETRPAAGDTGWIGHACPNCVGSMQVTSDAAWVGTQSAGVVRHDLTDGGVSHYGVAEGVGGRSVYAIDVAEDGTAWVATRRDSIITRRTGVSRFDGASWLAFDEADGLPSLQVGDLEAVAGGDGWVVTPEGMSRYSGGEWTTYTPAEGVTGAPTSVAVGADGSVYGGTNRGLAVLRGARFEAVDMAGLPSAAILDLALDGSGTVWALMQDGVGQWAPPMAGEDPAWSWHDIDLPDGPFGPPNDGISVDQAGRVWVVVDDLAWVREPAGWRTVTEAHEYAIETGFWPQVLAVSPSGGLWLGLLNEGVARFDRGWWSRLLLSDGPSNLVAMSVDVAPDGTVWVGYAAMTNGDNLVNGVVDGHWRRFDSRDGLPAGAVTGVWPAGLDVDRQGRPWVASDGGWIAWRDGATWASATVTEAFGSAVAPRSIAADERGGAWVGSASGGAAHYDGSGWSRITSADGLAGDSVYSIAVDPSPGRESVWFGTDAGVSRFDGTTWRTWTPPEAPATMTDIEVQGGAVWFAGTDADGAATVARYDGSNWIAYGAAEGLLGSRAWNLAFDRHGRAWAALVDDADYEAGGVAVLEGDRWRVISADDGLLSGVAFDVAIDATGRLWVATIAGVAELPGDRVPTPAPTGEPTSAAHLPQAYRSRR